MKKQIFTVLIFTVLTTLSLFVTLAAVSAYAQSDMRLNVNIPFEFSVRNKVLPAGEYTVSQITRDTLLIRSVDGNAHEIFLTLPSLARTTPNQSALVFNRYGDEYFLSKIWTSGKDTGHQLSESRAELELIRTTTALVKGPAERQIVSITAHR
jgi:hypothetical protein